MAELSEDQISTIRKLLHELGEIYPYKRVEATREMIDRYNAMFASDGRQIHSFAINVGKDVHVTDDMIWEAMTMKVGVEPTVFNDSNRFGNPPVSMRTPQPLGK